MHHIPLAVIGLVTALSAASDFGGFSEPVNIKDKDTRDNIRNIPGLRPGEVEMFEKITGSMYCYGMWDKKNRKISRGGGGTFFLFYGRSVIATNAHLAYDHSGKKRDLTRCWVKPTSDKAINLPDSPNNTWIKVLSDDKNAFHMLTDNPPDDKGKGRDLAVFGIAKPLDADPLPIAWETLTPGTEVLGVVARQQRMKKAVDGTDAIGIPGIVLEAYPAEGSLAPAIFTNQSMTDGGSGGLLAARRKGVWHAVGILSYTGEEESDGMPDQLSVPEGEFFKSYTMALGFMGEMVIKAKEIDAYLARKRSQ